MLARGPVAYISRISHIAPKIQLAITRTFLALPVNTMAKKEGTQRPKRCCTRMGVINSVRTRRKLNPERSNNQTLGGRVAEECRLVIGGALPTALISYCSYSIFLHYQQLHINNNTTTMHPPRPLCHAPSELTQLQALCGTDHRIFVPPIDLNRPEFVSLKRARPIKRSVQKETLSSGSRSAAPSKVTNYYFRGPWPTISMYLVRLVRTHIYDYLWPLGKIPCHTDHIYDFGRNIVGRQAIYMGFANTLLSITIDICPCNFIFV